MAGAAGQACGKKNASHAEPPLTGAVKALRAPTPPAMGGISQMNVAASPDQSGAAVCQIAVRRSGTMALDRKSVIDI
jgi:hypothetical protein